MTTIDDPIPQVAPPPGVVPVAPPCPQGPATRSSTYSDAELAAIILQSGFFR